MHDIVIIIDRAQKLAKNADADATVIDLKNRAIAADAWLANPPKDATETQIDATHEWLETVQDALGSVEYVIDDTISSCPM